MLVSFIYFCKFWSVNKFPFCKAEDTISAQKVKSRVLKQGIFIEQETADVMPPHHRQPPKGT